VSLALPHPAWALRDEEIVEETPGSLVSLHTTLRAGSEEKFQKTVLNDWHREHIGKGVMGPFGGFDMPIHYGSITHEHAAVRGKIGLFDVSHMGIIEIKGPDATQFLNRVTTRRADALREGGCQVCFIFNDEGDLVDETMVFKFRDDHYRLVVNAGHSGGVIQWFGEVKARDEFSGKTIAIQDLRKPSDPKDSRLILALQGPETLATLAGVMDRLDHEAIRDMKPLTHREVTVAGIKLLVSKTGWTGEKGFEFMIHPEDVPTFWSALIGLGIPPIGLGARDSLRLEASLRLSGDDLWGKPKITPTEAGYGDLGFIDWEAPFIGKEPLREKEQASRRRVANLVVTSTEEGKIDLSKPFPSPRFNEETNTGHAVRVRDGGGWKLIGEIRSSGIVSQIWDLGELGNPEKGVRIAAALIDREYAKPGQELQIEYRPGKFIYVRVLPNFLYWNGWGKKADLKKMLRFLREVAEGKVGESLSKEFGGISAGLEETALAKAVTDSSVLGRLKENGFAELKDGYIVDPSRAPTQALLVLQAGVEQPSDLPENARLIRSEETTVGGMLRFLRGLAATGQYNVAFSTAYFDLNEARAVIPAIQPIPGSILLDSGVRISAQEMSAAFLISQRTGTIHIHRIRITQFTSPNWNKPLLYVQIQA